MSTTTKSELAIRRELAKVERAAAELIGNLPRGTPAPRDLDLLSGAQQALAWVLGRHAVAPTKAYANSQRRA